VAKISKFKEMANDQLVEAYNQAKEELFNLKSQKVTGQLKNTARIPLVKKDIARIKTLLREKRDEGRPLR
jgi:large subunit ribosomal protein L29